MRNYTLVPILILLAALLSAGCDEQVDTDKADPKSNLPPARVDLPSVPDDLGKSAIPARHPDGSMTVDGVKRNRLAWLDKEVSVTGQIAWIYDCPYDDKKKKRRKKARKKAGEGEEGPKCQRAHFYVVDKQGDPKQRLLVVGLTAELEESFEKGDLKTGDDHTMTGTFVEIGDGFVASDEGMLMLGTIKGFEPKEEAR